MTQHVIIITGMHRSGTSLVASILQEAGVDIGEKLLGPAWGNHRGHFEDIDFFNFHDNLLKRFKQTLLVQDLACLGTITPAETQMALNLIDQRHNRSIWGWKDPRTALFLDFWHDLLPQARYIFVYRHPLEVVFSLLRRGTDREAVFNPLAGLRSWQVYNQALLNFYQKHRESCFLGHITTITADVQTFVQRIVQKLALPLTGGIVQGLYHPAELKQEIFPSIVTAILEKLTPEAMAVFTQLEAQADLPGHFSNQIVAQPSSQLIELQERVANQGNNLIAEKDELAQLFEQLLFVLEPEVVRLNHIHQLQSRIDELQHQLTYKDIEVNHLKERLNSIENTKSWRLVLKWYTFKQHLKTLSRAGPSLPSASITSRIPASQSRLPIKSEGVDNSGGPLSVLFISHYAGRTGAPIILLNFLKWFKANTTIPFEILLKDDGELRSEFEALAPTIVWNKTLSRGEELAYREQVTSHFKQARVGLIYANTITVGDVIAALSGLSCPVLTHVHELEYWINHRVEPKSLRQIQKYTHHYIAVSQAVKQNLVDNLEIPEDKISLVYEFIPTQPTLDYSRIGRIRRQLNIPDQALIVGGSGTTEWRKGPDLFVQLARAVHQHTLQQSVHFVWVGGENRGPNFATLWYDVKRMGLEQYVHFVGERPNPLDYFAAFDVFALVSREDPFPLVELEAASLGKPIVCFDGSGGAKEFVEADCGFVVPYLDLEVMADRVVELLFTPELRQCLGKQAAQKVREQYDVAIVAPRIADIIELSLKK